MTYNWGETAEQIKEKMSSNYLLQSSTDDALVFKLKDSQIFIAYRLTDGGLSASTVFMANEIMDVSSLLPDYLRYGILDGVEIYKGNNNNNLASFWIQTGLTGKVSVIGFAPIHSGAYPSAPKIAVETGEVDNIKATRVTVKGRVDGASNPITVGFIYGRQPNLSKTNGKMVTTSSTGDFELTLEHLSDETQYYYRAFAVEDDYFYYYGSETSFTTSPLTYKIDGKEFSMIHITGTSVAPFAIMQTEVHPSKDIVIEGATIPKLNGNGDAIIIQAELIRLIQHFRDATGLQFRQCSSEEWLVAASGNQEFTYSGSNNLNEVGWYSSNSGNTFHDVALKQYNGYGIYDMSGNFREVVAASIGEELKKPYINIDGNLYGGCWQDTADKCKVTSFINGDSSSRYVPGTSITETNAVAAKTATVRLVYSLE